MKYHINDTLLGLDPFGRLREAVTLANECDRRRGSNRGVNAYH